MQLSNDLITSIRSHSGISNLPSEAIEIVWEDAEKAAQQNGSAVEFHAAALAKALYAQHAMETRRNGKPVDFDKFCKEQLADKGDSLWAKMFARKSKVAQAVAEAQQLEAEVTETKAALVASQQKVTELTNSI